MDTPVLTLLTRAVRDLAKSAGHTSSTSASGQRTKVRIPDQFDGSELRKLRTFLIQCELCFQDRPRAFRTDHAKVVFAQSYLKGMALEWFEPDLLLSEPSAFRPLWMDSYSEFVLELRMNFGPHDPIDDAEHQLRRLSMTDSQRVNKYVVEFNRIACQVRGYGDSALRHLFYQGLPDRIKDEISRIGKPSALSDMRTLAQLINARYWECKSELSRQTTSASTPPSPSVSSSSPIMPSGSASTSDPHNPTSNSNTSDPHSLPPSNSNSDPSDDSSSKDSDPSSPLESDGESSDT